MHIPLYKIDNHKIDFHEEFMSKANEFSLSWRNQIGEELKKK
jgi:hypothetical protein